MSLVEPQNDGAPVALLVLAFNWQIGPLVVPSRLALDPYTGFPWIHILAFQSTVYISPDCDINAFPKPVVPKLSRSQRVMEMDRGSYAINENMLGTKTLAQKGFLDFAVAVLTSGDCRENNGHLCRCP